MRTSVYCHGYSTISTNVSFMNEGQCDIPVRRLVTNHTTTLTGATPAHPSVLMDGSKIPVSIVT